MMMMNTLSRHPRLARVIMKSQKQREAQLQFKYLRLCYKDGKGDSKQDCSCHNGTQGVACDVNYLIYYSYVIIEMKYAALCDHETK